MRILGVDPGVSGAIAIVCDGKAEVMKLPIMGKEIDIAAVRDWVEELLPVDMAFIEKVGAMPGQGVTSMFTFGRATGEMIGMLKTMGIPFQEVTPQAWKARVLAGTNKDKDAAIAYVRKKYPTTSLLPTPRSRVPDNGMADAVCIAEYGLGPQPKVRGVRVAHEEHMLDELWQKQ